MAKIKHPLPIGTKIKSLNGETACDDSGDEVTTPPGVVGVVDGVYHYPLQGWVYDIGFPDFGISVFVDQAEPKAPIDDPGAYEVVELPGKVPNMGGGRPFDLYAQFVNAIASVNVPPEVYRRYAEKNKVRDIIVHSFVTGLTEIEAKDAIFAKCGRPLELTVVMTKRQQGILAAAMLFVQDPRRINKFLALVADSGLVREPNGAFQPPTIEELDELGTYIAHPGGD